MSSAVHYSLRCPKIYAGHVLETHPDVVQSTSLAPSMGALDANGPLAAAFLKSPYFAELAANPEAAAADSSVNMLLNDPAVIAAIKKAPRYVIPWDGYTSCQSNCRPHLAAAAGPYRLYSCCRVVTQMANACMCGVRGKVMIRHGSIDQIMTMVTRTLVNMSLIDYL